MKTRRAPSDPWECYSLTHAPKVLIYFGRSDLGFLASFTEAIYKVVRVERHLTACRTLRLEFLVINNFDKV